ncbi:MAG: transporter substrate-binding domain-containing protein, partial [Alphaproteobacteria bacterium]|nr:transporter substrate-binding domain-containing protein [Alphaproteobacteria bacterium]
MLNSRHILRFLSAACLLVLWGGVFSGDRAAAQDARLTLGANTWKPYVEFHDGGSANGLAVEKLKVLAGQLDILIDVENLPFKRALLHAQSGESDGVLLSANRAEREEYLTYSDPVFCERRILITRKGDGFDWSDPQALSGKRVTIGNGFYKGNILTKWEEESLIPPISEIPIGDIFNFLKMGRTDVIVYSEAETKILISQGRVNIADFEILSEPLNELTLHIG